MASLRAGLHRLVKDERGSVLGEYGLWIALIVIVAAAALSPLGSKMAAIFGDLCTRMNGGTAC